MYQKMWYKIWLLSIAYLTTMSHEAVYKKATSVATLSRFSLWLRKDYPESESINITLNVPI